MRVAFVAPNYNQETRGNAVTVRRIANSLRTAGCIIEVFPPEESGPDLLLHRISQFAPDCIHAFHAWQGGRPARELAACLKVPYLVTITGTDIYAEWSEAERDELLEIMNSATALTVFHESVRQRVLRQQPWLTVPVEVVPQGVAVSKDLPAESPPGRVIFFLPAGIRPVKNVLFPLEPLAELFSRFPEFRFELAGPVLDSGYAAEVMETVGRYPFASWLGELPHESMATKYAEVGVVLNTSHSEGGMANSLLEAMSAARPVLVADIEGNRSLVNHGVNGMTYADRSDFREKAALLLADRELRRRLGLAGRQYVGENFPLARERDGYLRLYPGVTGTATSLFHLG